MSKVETFILAVYFLVLVACGAFFSFVLMQAAEISLIFVLGALGIWAVYVVSVELAAQAKKKRK